MVDNTKIKNSTLEAKDFDYVMLIDKNTNSEEYDTIMCWDKKSDNKFIFLGFWNDGVVEQ